MLSGRLGGAIRGITNRDGVGVLQSDDVCTTTGRPVPEVLRDKHHTMRDPDLTGLNPGAFDPYESTPDTVLLNITATDFESIASNVQVPVAVASKPWISATGSCELAWSRKRYVQSWPY